MRKKHTDFEELFIYPSLEKILAGFQQKTQLKTEICNWVQGEEGKNTSTKVGVDCGSASVLMLKFLAVLV